MRQQVLLFLFFLIALLNSLRAQEASGQLDFAKQTIESIKKDDSNTSYTEMINQVIMPHHTFFHHKDNSSYFFTDNREIVSDIVSMVIERPQGTISKNSQDIIGIYREFDFEKDLSYFFKKEKRINGGYNGSHLGTTESKPTNTVVVFFKINDPAFIEAYPYSLK